MPRTPESQRIARSTDGHPMRQQMFAWNNSDAGKEAQRKYRETEAYKIRSEKERRLGGSVSAYVKNVRQLSRKNATQARQRWTANQVAELKKLLEEGYTCKEIGLVLQRSLQAIERKKARLEKADMKTGTTK